jgi:hypothetical protein
MIDATGPKPPITTDKVDDEDTMDALVQRASTPNLASLFKAGKDAGLIKAGPQYGNGA